MAEILIETRPVLTGYEDLYLVLRDNNRNFRACR